jgi:hypothetical protein
MQRRFLIPLLVALMAGVFGGGTFEGHPALEVTASTDAPDVSARVVKLGNPFAARFASSDKYYARNTWDLQTFSGRIYIGGGNSSNSGPAVAPGAIDVWYYSPAKNAFTKEFTVDDEQIDRYKIFNAKLYIPGHDPRESWSLGNFYRRDLAGWTKVRTIPYGIHTYDLAWHAGYMFAATGTQDGGEVARSADMGRTWKRFNLSWERAFTLFKLRGQLYVSSFGTQVHRYASGTFTPVSAASFFPGATLSGSYLVVRPVNFLNQLVYIAGKNVNDHQWVPRGLFHAPAYGSSQRIAPPSGRTYDLRVATNGKLYALVNTRIAADKYVVSVRSTTDLVRWTEVFRFTRGAFARSFEYHNGDFYFGLGSEPGFVSPLTGDILRVKASAYQ